MLKEQKLIDHELQEDGAETLLQSQLAEEAKLIQQKEEEERKVGI